MVKSLLHPGHLSETAPLCLDVQPLKLHVAGALTFGGGDAVAFAVLADHVDE